MESPFAPHAASPVELQDRLRLELQGDPFLVYRDGAGAQRLLALPRERDRVTIGRRLEADISLSWDTEASRLHAMLERVAGEWTVVDDGLSSNGTWLDNTRLHGRRRLCDGDVLRVGQTAIGYRNPAAGGSGATARSADVASVARVSEAQRRVLVALCRPLWGQTGFATPASNQQIADDLFISVDSVKTHLKALFATFGVESLPQNAKRVQLADRALRTGVVGERDYAEA